MNTATLTDAELSMNVANAMLVDLTERNNEHALDAKDFRYACLECGALELEDDPETYDCELCDACWSRDHFECEVCGEDFENDDVHSDYPGLCCDCGDERQSDERTAEITETRDEISDLLDSWDGDDDELLKLKWVLACLKAMK